MLLKQADNFTDMVENDLTFQMDTRKLMTIYALYDIRGKSCGDFLAFQATVVTTDAEN